MVMSSVAMNDITERSGRCPVADRERNQGGVAVVRGNDRCLIELPFCLIKLRLGLCNGRIDPPISDSIASLAFS